MNNFILDDKEAYLGLFSTVCSFCVHKKPLKWSCDAFDEIPEEIWFGKHLHKVPYPGDRGIVFKPKK